VPDIHAIGECAEHRGQCYGLVEPAYEQARVLAQRLAGRDARYPGSVLATNLKVSGVRVFSCGDFLGAPGTEVIVLSDPGLKTYKKLVIANDRLVGAVLFGDTADGPWYLELIRSGQRIETLRDALVFGRAFANAVVKLDSPRTDCPQDEKLGKSTPERAAVLSHTEAVGPSDFPPTH
jgi:nitrite reductase (NADH) large subunit